MTLLQSKSLKMELNSTKFSHQNVGRRVQLRQRQWDKGIALIKGLNGAGKARLWTHSLPAGQ